MPVCQTSKPPQRKQLRTPRQKQKTRHLEADAQSPDDADSSDGDFKLHKHGKEEPIMVSVILNEQKLDMEVDTGTAFSVISEATRRAVFANENTPL